MAEDFQIDQKEERGWKVMAKIEYEQFDHCLQMIPINWPLCAICRYEDEILHEKVEYIARVIAIRTFVFRYSVKEGERRERQGNEFYTEYLLFRNNLIRKGMNAGHFWEKEEHIIGFTDTFKPLTEMTANEKIKKGIKNRDERKGEDN